MKAPYENITFDHELFEKLSQLHGVSGYETPVRKYIAELVKPLCDEVFVDAIGNVIAVKYAIKENPDKKRIMFAAHTDEIGLQVMKVNGDGTLMVKNLGWDFIHTSYQSRVQFRNGVTGIVSARVRPENLGGDRNNLFVDIGCSSKEAAEKYVNIGDVCCFVGPYTKLVDGYLTTKAIDDRIGCYIQIEVLKQLQGKETVNDLYFAFTVQEEVGCRGGKTAAARILPDMGFAVDVTPGQDRPGDLEGSNTMGIGCAVKISDTSVICDEQINEVLFGLCKEYDIPCQKEVLAVGGTDASAINQSGVGARAAAVSVVTRYAHGPNTLLNEYDANAAVALLTEAAGAVYRFE